MDPITETYRSRIDWMDTVAVATITIGHPKDSMVFEYTGTSMSSGYPDKCLSFRDKDGKLVEVHLPTDKLVTVMIRDAPRDCGANNKK